jgi:hypothetical protein
MPNRRFAERLNKELDSIGMPLHHSERTKAFAKLAKLPKFKAQSLLNGTINPDELLLKLLAEELDVSEDYLEGISDKRSN